MARPEAQIKPVPTSTVSQRNHEGNLRWPICAKHPQKHSKHPQKTRNTANSKHGQNKWYIGKDGHADTDSYKKDGHLWKRRE